MAKTDFLGNGGKVNSLLNVSPAPCIQSVVEGNIQVIISYDIQNLRIWGDTRFLGD